jgi:hypothetical protein
MPETTSFHRPGQGASINMGGHEGRITSVAPTQWHVDTISDVFGHQITYQYEVDSKSESLGEIGLDIAQMRLDSISYNYPTTTATPVRPFTIFNYPNYT